MEASWQEPGTQEPWNFGTSGTLWDLGTLEPWNLGSSVSHSIAKKRRLLTSFGIDLAVLDALWLCLEIVLPQPLELDVAGLRV